MERHKSRHAVGPLSWSDFIELSGENPRELLDGWLVATEMPTRSHERIVAGLITALGVWSWTHGSGEVLASGYKIKIDEHRGLTPDVQLYRAGNVPCGQDRGLECGRPDLVVEVMSPESRSYDSLQKLYDYASLGVPEYWLVDPAVRMLQQLILHRGTYCIATITGGDSIFRPHTFADLEIELSRLWL